MTNYAETIIVGAGQAGLSASYFLSQGHRDHILFERASQPGEAWRNRWDSFTFVTTNALIRLPGGEYQGNEPEGFMPRASIIEYFNQYVAKTKPPVKFNVGVSSVEKEDGHYRVTTNEGIYQADNVIISTGTFQQPKIPDFGKKISAEIYQIGSIQYRNPETLPPGAVLVVGSAQSGCQIAEELYQSGRKVYLGTGGSSGRVPRRYRGKDITTWLNLVGFFDRTVDKLPSPRARFGGNPQASGKNGGHTINLHQFARDGVVLLGHVQDGEGSRLTIAPDLKENLAKMDKFEFEILKAIDQYILKNGLDLPEEVVPQLRNGYDLETITEIDLKSTGITSIIWANGFAFDYRLVKLPILDEYGYPIQQRGVTTYPGLYFLGLHWLYTMKSGILLGVGEDASFVVSHLLARKMA